MEPAKAMTRAHTGGTNAVISLGASPTTGAYAALLALLLSGHGAFSTEPYRLRSPAGNPPYHAVLLVPGCATAANAINLYDERAAELQAAGYVVVFVDYVGRRMQSNCAHVSRSRR